MDYDQLNELLKASSNSNKRNFDDLFRAINKRKIFIIISFIVVFAAGYYYLKNTTKIYESVVLLNKENPKTDLYRDDPYRRIAALQSQDDISTDVVLVTTNSVLDKVANSLNYKIYVNRIVYPNGEIIDIEKPLPAYYLFLSKNKYSQSNFPIFLINNPDTSDETISLMLKYSRNNTFELYKVINNKETFVSSFSEGNPIDIDNFKTLITWQRPKAGTRFYFTILSKNAACGMLKGKVTVSQKETTNLIEISIKDEYPELAQLIAKTLVEKFNEARTEQQRQNIQLSFLLIDNQLNEISKKLRKAEDDLSNYQSANRITKIDRSSDEMVRFLSSLEAERINTDLKLSEYEEKQGQMYKEYSNKGYFDQTYLSPSQTEQTSSPFSSLLIQLNDLEVKKIELLQKETESHPDIVNLNNQISKIKNQLSSYNQNTLTAYNIIIGTLKDKKGKLDNLINQYQARIQSQPKKETRLAGLTRDKDVYEKVFNLLLDKREELRVKEISQLQDIIVVDNPSLPTSPVIPNRNLTLIACLFIWGSLSVIYLYIGEYKERKFLRLDEIEKDLKLTLLSIIPAYSKKLKKQVVKPQKFEDRFPVLSHDEVGVIESYRVLRTWLTFHTKEDTKIIMFTSCEEHSGKTSIVANLAISLASLEKKVLMIDGDLKRCTLSDTFNISRKLPGLNTFLKGDYNKPPIINLNSIFGKAPSERFLSLLSAGDVSEHSSNLLQTSKASELINALKVSSYDYILIDTPPITRVVDSLILSRLIGNVILVVRYNYSLRESVEWGIEEIKKEKTNILGIIANDCDVKKSSFKHKYGYGYSYKYAYEPRQKNTNKNPSK